MVANERYIKLCNRAREAGCVTYPNLLIKNARVNTACLDWRNGILGARIKKTNTAYIRAAS